MRKISPTLLLIAMAVCFLVACAKDTKVPAPVSETSTTTQTTEITQTTTSTQTTGTTAPVNVVKVAGGTACCKTENVIIVVIDGPRFSETWGDYTKQNIPGRYNLYGRGVLLGNFMNNGTTNTDSGHDAICTGNYEDLENWGQQLPQYPSIFQSFLKSTGKPAEKAWIVTSKDKLQILANCKQTGWEGTYMPRTDCGRDGIFSGYRSDDTTMAHAKNVMQTYHPNLMLINFKDPDVFGHGNQWNKYIEGIKSTDKYIANIYELIQADDTYRDKTTLIVTNDHGRHLDKIATGFIDHGDGCEGCRHIEFFAVGPDFKKGYGSHTAYEQIDISQTVAKLLNFKMEHSKGKVITDIFN
jgi:hypothetical protein